MTDVNTDTDAWPTRQDAAEELTRFLGEPVSVNTMMGWLRQPGCPMPRGKGPISKQPLKEWAQSRRGAGRASGSTGDYADLELEKLREEVRRLKGQNARIYEESINAEDARTCIVRAMEEFRRELSQEVPAAAWAACQGHPVDEAVAAIRTLINAALQRACDAARKLR